MLSECESRLTELNKLLEAKELEKDELESKGKQLEKQVANVKVRERELVDSLQLMKQEEEVRQKEREVKKYKDQLRSMGIEGYEG